MSGKSRERAMLAAGVGYLRFARRWTQQQLATQSGISPEIIKQIEKGLKDPQLSTLLKLVRVFELSSVEQLFGPLPTELLR